MSLVLYMPLQDEDEDEDDSFRSRQNEVLKRDLRRCQSFNNLKKLSVDDWYVDVDLSALIYLLRCSPIIEKLTLHLGMVKISYLTGVFICFLITMLICFQFLSPD